MRGVQTAEGRRRFQFCIERFQVVGRLFLQLGNLVTFNFGILAALGRSARSAARPCTRYCGFEASETIPFPGADSIFSIGCGAISGRLRFDRGCGLSGRSASGRRPEAASLASLRRPSAGRKIRDGTMQDSFGIQKAGYQGFRLIETNITKIRYTSVLASKFPRTPTPRRTRSAGLA
jgi:hypothetical protein